MNKIEKLNYSNVQTYKVGDMECQMLALKAIQKNIGTIVVGPTALPVVNKILKGNDSIKVAVTVAYPSGAYIVKAKIQEIEGLFEAGERFDELCVVMGVNRYLSGYAREAEEEIKQLKKAAGRVPVKLMIEAGLMTKEQKKEICDFAAAAGVEYIVASTGFTPYDLIFPTVEDIRELSAAAAGRLQIIACGEVDTKRRFLDMIQAGAAYVMTARAYEIAEELEGG